MEKLDHNMPIIDFPTEDAPFFSKQVMSPKRFFRTVIEDFSLPLQVIAGGRESCAEGYSINRKNFPYYAFEFVTSGRGILTLNKNTYDLFPGTVFLYGPGTPHSIQNCLSQPLVKYFATFTGIRASFLLHEKLELIGKVVHSTEPSMVLHTFEDLVESGLKNSLYSTKICSTLLELLLYKIADSSLDQKEIYSSAFQTYQKCRNIIEQDFLEIFDLTQAAERCCLNESYLCRLFKRFDHRSPYKFLMQLKITHAAEVLLTNKGTIKELSFRMGFSDQYHFSRAFKQVLGFSPREYLKMSTQ